MLTTLPLRRVRWRRVILERSPALKPCANCNLVCGLPSRKRTALGGGDGKRRRFIRRDGCDQRAGRAEFTRTGVDAFGRGLQRETVFGGASHGERLGWLRPQPSP